MNTRRILNVPLTYPMTALAVVFVSIMGAYIEYYYMLLQSLPYREIKVPTFGFLYPYDAAFFLPLILLLAFAPASRRMLVTHSFAYRRTRKPFAFGVACALLGLILKDAAWFMYRATAPLATDPLGHQFIQPTDYTASFIGHAQIGITIPLWYIVLIVPIAAITISLSITTADATGVQRKPNLPENS